MLHAIRMPGESPMAAIMLADSEHEPSCCMTKLSLPTGYRVYTIVFCSEALHRRVDTCVQV